MSTTDQGFREWAIVELFGHQKIAGVVTEANIGGCSFVRVDVPETERRPALTRYLGNGAIYAINPVDEATGRLAVEHLQAEPAVPYSVHRALELQAAPPIDEGDLETDPDLDSSCGE